MSYNQFNRPFSSLAGSGVGEKGTYNIAMELIVTDKPIKKRNTRQPSLIGENIQTVTLRVYAPEREILYKNATDSFRSINTQVIHTLRLFLRRPVTGSRVTGVKSYSMAYKGEKICSFGLRLPLPLYTKLREESERSGCSLNAIMRYALFKHPAP